MEAARITAVVPMDLAVPDRLTVPVVAVRVAVRLVRHRVMMRVPVAAVRPGLASDQTAAALIIAVVPMPRAAPLRRTVSVAVVAVARSVMRPGITALGVIRIPGSARA